jgi:hypothetical protein
MKRFSAFRTWEDVEIEKQYLDAGYHRYERRYKLVVQRQDYSLICVIGENAVALERADTEGAGGRKNFPTTRSTVALRKLAAEFLCNILSRAGREKAVVTYCKQARKWFLEHHCFLL